MTKAKGKAAYMISAVAEQYAIHPQTLRLYEREGLLAPSRSEGNTRLYTDEDLERLEVILKLTRELGVNLAGVEIILNMREKMEAMQQQMEGLIENLNQELSQRISDRPTDNNSLMPVIQINTVTRNEARRVEGKRKSRESGGHWIGFRGTSDLSGGEVNYRHRTLLGNPTEKPGAAEWRRYFRKPPHRATGGADTVG